MSKSTSALLRASSNLKIKDADASLRVVGSQSEDRAAAKAEDKVATQLLANQISELHNIFYAQKKHKLLIVLQGIDTSGKDGTMRGVFGSLSPLGVRTVAFKAPTPVELEHDYLWRIHNEMPRTGEIAIFNRSHYEDVLVTKVHHWIDDEECARRYAQIRDFERMLAETGTVILKFFLHISKDEQKRRLQERIADEDKHWKFDPQDLVEREHWNEYQSAYERAIIETDKAHAPWFVIPADSKTKRNLAIAQIVVEKLTELKLSYPPGKPEFSKIIVS
jgi:PPK2 family polyphosphate:nucleotide phosphotransferase